MSLVAAGQVAEPQHVAHAVLGRAGGFAFAGEDLDLVLDRHRDRSRAATSDSARLVVLDEFVAGPQILAQPLGLALDVDDLQVVERRLQRVQLLGVQLLVVGQLGGDRLALLVELGHLDQVPARLWRRR